MSALEKRVERLEERGRAMGVSPLIIAVEGHPDFDERISAGRASGAHLIVVRRSTGRRIWRSVP
jgi:hypothetical protein